MPSHLSRRAISLRPVNSEKVEVSWSNLAQDASAAKSVLLALAKKVPTATSTDVKTGTTIKWLYFEFNVNAETLTTTKIFHWLIEKNPFGQGASTPSAYNADNKRFVIKRGMEMLVKDNQSLIKRIFVVPIPKKMQRMGDNDSWNFRYIVSSTQTINTCGIVIYRKYE